MSMSRDEMETRVIRCRQVAEFSEREDRLHRMIASEAQVIGEATLRVKKHEEELAFVQAEIRELLEEL